MEIRENNPGNSAKKPRPAAEDYLRRKEIENSSKKGGVNEDAWMEIMNSFDWSHELTCEGDLYGLKNALGEVLLPSMFENFTMLTEQELNFGDRVVTQLGGKWGVIVADGKGTWLLKPEFDYIGYPNDITHFRKNGKWGIIDIREGINLVDNCDEVTEWNGFMFMNRVGTYKKGGKWGVVMDWGAITDPIFEEVGGDTDDGPVEVKYNGKTGYINEKIKFTEDEEEAYFRYYLD